MQVYTLDFSIRGKALYKAFRRRILTPTEK